MRLRWLTAAGIAAIVAIYALLAWDRRWIADDGLIVVRVVREILAGHGPVYCPQVRAEPTTSTLWLWLVAAAGWLTRADVAQLAVGLGGGLAVAGLAIALDAARRFRRASSQAGALLPAGALVVVAVFPFWDYATSGLESGLAMFWLAAIWWLLGRLRPDSGQRALTGFAFVVGLGPLVRPDFGLATLVFLVAGWLIARPPRRALWRLGAAALAVPLGYEVFRAGYYGVLVPLPALAKSASGAEWARGWLYFVHFIVPHLLFVPLGVLAVAALLDRRAVLGRDVVDARRSAVLLAAPVASAALLALYVIRVGGDFMHGRLLLPTALLLVMPVMLVPLGRITALATAAVAAWALFVGIRSYTAKHPVFGDERAGYVKLTQHRNPTTAADHITPLAYLEPEIAEALRTGQRTIFDDGGVRVAMSRAQDARVGFVAARLGVAGALVPLDDLAIDVYGLANPLAAHITRTQPGKTGHEKNLPWAWVLADVADPSVTQGATPTAIAAARHALTCGELAELLASTRAAMTPSRFWANLTGSLARTQLVIPADPVEAERQLCR